jgi:uncharacterized membrane protein
MRIATAYIAALVVFTLIDLIWLGVVAKGFYRHELRTLLADEVRIPAAVLFYLCYPAGLVLFAVSPALQQGDVLRAAALGAAFGFFAYATYDLTNWATLKDWSAKLTVVDLTWGTLISAVTSAAAFMLVRNL